MSPHVIFLVLSLPVLVFAWLLYRLGDLLWWILERGGHSDAWADFWYPAYNKVVLTADGIEAWVDGGTSE